MSCAVTAQLIWAFVFAYAKIRFSHDVAQTVFKANYSIEIKLQEIRRIKLPGQLAASNKVAGQKVQMRKLISTFVVSYHALKGLLTVISSPEPKAHR